MRKLIIIYIALFVLSVVLTSCNIANAINLENDDLASYIKDLSDDSLQGRLVDTEGNKKAMDYIVGLYKELGLSPYAGESFLHSYKHKVLDFNNNSLISIFDENGKQIDFTYGKDYLQASVVEDNFTGPIISDKNHNNISNSFIVLSNEDEIGDFIGKAKGIFVKSKTLKKYTGSNKEKGTPLIQIDEKMFDYLSNNKNLSITYNCEYTTREFDADNIIGLIPGSQHEKALILSAHFDHVGIVGNNVYSGAVDNCSGVSVLLDLAKKLQLRAKESPFDFDIYICAFNGEEANLQGSKSFVNYVKNHHSNIVNINLDTLGDKSKEILILGDPKVSHTLVHLISDWFKQNNQSYKVEPDKYRSDHISFQNAEIPSISLIQEKNDIIHSTEDKFDIVDIEFLRYFSNLIYEFITDIHNKVFDIYNECEHTDEGSVNSEVVEMPEDEGFEKLLQETRSKLKFGEYIVINKYNRKERIYNSKGVFKSLDELLSIYPDMSSPFKSKNFSLERITVFDNAFPEARQDIIYDKVYKNEIKTSNIRSIEFLYNLINENGKLIIRLELKDNQLVDQSPDSQSEIITSDKGKQYTLRYNPDGMLIEIIGNVDAPNNNYVITIRKGSIKDITINNETHKNAFVFDWNINDNKEDIQAIINSINLDIFP